jgi:hypothetical protein
MTKNNDILTIGLLGLGAYALFTLRKPLEGVGAGLETGVTGIGEGVSRAFTGVGGGLRDTGQAVGTISTEIAETVTAFSDVPQSFLSGANMQINEGFENLGNLTNQFSRFLRDKYDQTFNTEKDLVQVSNLTTPQLLNKINESANSIRKLPNIDATKVIISPGVTNNPASRAIRTERKLAIPTIVRQPERDSQGLTKFDRIIAENKRKKSLRS